jgi:hypothetical protein
VPANQLQNIASIQLQVTATASKPDNRGQFAQTTIATQVNASRSVPRLQHADGHGVRLRVQRPQHQRARTADDVGIPSSTVRMGNYVAYTNSLGFYQSTRRPGAYTIRHTPAMGYGSFASPDTFNVALTNTPDHVQSFADTARQGGSSPSSRTTTRTRTASVTRARMACRHEVQRSRRHARRSRRASRLHRRAVAVHRRGRLQRALHQAGLGDRDASTKQRHGHDDERRLQASRRQFGLYNQQLGHITGKVYVDANRNGTSTARVASAASGWA